ncbi:MAG: DUF3232 domain-containing protein [Clostridia bacterium]|nr:DUF3232 domain-containing protein [Clostridia bacterium]
MLELNTAVLEQMMSFYRDDDDAMGLIHDALHAFEKYHTTIYSLETQKKMYARGAMTTETYRETIPDLDRARTLAHNTVIMDVRILNRLAQKAGLSPVYEGTVSEERPYRRELADAVLSYVSGIIENRS